MRQLLMLLFICFSLSQIIEHSRKNAADEQRVMNLHKHIVLAMVTRKEIAELRKEVDHE